MKCFKGCRCGGGWVAPSTAAAGGTVFFVGLLVVDLVNLAMVLEQSI
jgi:hypothetical protein